MVHLLHMTCSLIRLARDPFDLGQGRLLAPTDGRLRSGRHQEELYFCVAHANPSGCFPASIWPTTSRVFKSTTATLSAMLTAT
jgi:hypothetical protein